MKLDSLIVAGTALAERLPTSADELVTVRHVQQTERSSTAIAIIRPGGGLRPHFHREHDEIIVFLSGHGVFRIGDHLRPVGPNDVITVPAGVVHATVRAETTCVLAAVFAPRFDLINEDRVFVD